MTFLSIIKNKFQTRNRSSQFKTVFYFYYLALN